jgi:putative inorganic carbon (HCO3(-)) transporter
MNLFAFDGARQRDPENSRHATVVRFILIAVALLCSALLVSSAAMGFKWLFLCCLAMLVVAVSLVVPNFRLFMVLSLVACIPLAIQYKPLDRSTKYTLLDHFGGAEGTLVVNLVDFPIAALFMMWLVDLATNRVRLPRWQPFDTGVMVFLFVSALSAFNTDEHALLFFEMVRYLKYYLLLWMLRTYLVEKDFIRYCFYVVAAGAGLQFLLACMQYFLFFNLPFPVGGVSGSQFDMISNTLILRVTGTVGHANTFSAYLLFPLILSFVLMLSDASQLTRRAAAGLFMATSLALVLTFSRNAWLFSTLAVVLLWASGVAARKISTATVFGVLGLAIVVLGALVVSGVMEVILVRLLEDDGKAYDSRWDLIGVALNMVKAHPVLGIGLNSFEENMTYYDTTGVTNIIKQPVHNTVFLIAAESGLPSLAMFLVLCGVVARQVMVIVRRRDEDSFSIGVPTGIALLVLLLSNQFDVTLRKEPILGMCAFVIAAVMATASKEGHGRQPVPR